MNKQVRILLVEDEDTLMDAIKLNLELEGYYVVGSTNGSEALQQFSKQRFDLVILDIMLPEMSGIAVCEHIRLKDKRTPILFLTARDSSEDRVLGLKIGADDYLTKPFNLEEFILRVQNLVRRNTIPETDEGIMTFKFGVNEINFSTFEVNSNGKPCTLSNKEIQLLRLFSEKQNQVVARTEILEKIWGYDVYPSTRTIDNFILTFRKLFEENPKKPKYFHSIRGIGYKFTP